MSLSSWARSTLFSLFLSILVWIKMSKSYRYVIQELLVWNSGVAKFLCDNWSQFFFSLASKGIQPCLYWKITWPHFESVRSVMNSNIFTGLNVFFKALNFCFWQVPQSFDFTLHQHCKGYIATINLYWWRKISGAPLCIISGTSRHPSRTTDVPQARCIASSHERIQSLMGFELTVLRGKWL